MTLAPMLEFRRLFRSRQALSTVTTTLIILVISVVLASVVSYFAINVSSTRQQEESLFLGQQHVWYSSVESDSQLAILIVNTGGRDVVVQKVTVRGQTVNWSQSFHYRGEFTLTSRLTYIEDITNGSFTPISDGQGSFEQITRTRGDLPLRSGESMLVYVKDPDSIAIGDVGLTVAINVYTLQAIYYKEANVETPIEGLI